MQQLVVRAPDHAEAARAETLEQPVAAEHQRRCERPGSRPAARASRPRRCTSVRGDSTGFRVRRRQRRPLPRPGRKRPHEREVAGWSGSQTERQSYCGLRSILQGASFCRSSTMARRQLLGRHRRPPGARAERSHGRGPGRASAAPRGPSAFDQHTLMVRRRDRRRHRRGRADRDRRCVVNSCLKSGTAAGAEELQPRGQPDRARIRQTGLAAAVHHALGRRGQVGDQRPGAGQPAAHRGREPRRPAKGLSVPGEMSAAQRNLLLAMNLRVEGITKIAGLLPTALGGQGKQAADAIAGDMEIFLASDVVYSQRVAPLIQQTLAANGIHAEHRASPLPAEPRLARTDDGDARADGKSTRAEQRRRPPGTHGSALIGRSVGDQRAPSRTDAEPLTGGGSPTFTVTRRKHGRKPGDEREGRRHGHAPAASSSRLARDQLRPNPARRPTSKSRSAACRWGWPRRSKSYVEAVPGETNIENNKSTYLAIFGK